ncbi:MAG TPA: hypothetical protein VGL21_07155, partial [Jatrophihabitantaceae bacterium]
RIVNGRPVMHFLPWDPEVILRENLTDMNVLAHRAGPIRFDEKLACFGDWDLLIQLTRDTRPVEVPAIAVYYRTHRDDRLSLTLTEEVRSREYAAIRKKLDPDATAQAAERNA